MDKYTVKIIPVLRKYGVKKASLFGSVVRGDIDEKSDVDILIELPKKLRGLDFIGMKMDLQEELEKKLKKKSI